MRWGSLNEEGKDRMLDAWADGVKSLMVAALLEARQQERPQPYHSVQELCDACGFTRPRWPAVRERMIARGMPLSHRCFYGYYWGDMEAVKTVLQHPMYVVSGIFKAVRSTTVAMAQGGHEPGDVRQYIAETGVSPAVFCRTIASWDGVDPLPKVFEVALLESGE